MAESNSPAIEVLVSEARGLDEVSDSEEVGTSLFRDTYPTLRIIGGSWPSIRSPHDAGSHEEISTVEDEAALVRSLCLSANQTLFKTQTNPNFEAVQDKNLLDWKFEIMEAPRKKTKSSNIGTMSCILETGSPILTVFHVVR